MNFFNHMHLGDSVYSLIYLNKLKEQYDNINFSVKKNYIQEISLLNYKNIKIKTLQNGINMWINSNNDWTNFIKNKKIIYYDEFFLKFYNDFSIRNNFKISFKNLEDTLFYHPDLEFSRYEHYDILIMNSIPQSDQYQYNNKFNEKIISLSKNFKIITTEKIKNITCTRDKNMSLLDVANLSLNCDIIIGIHSAPYSVVLNKKTIKTVKKWFVLNKYNITYKLNKNFYQYDDITKIKL